MAVRGPSEDVEGVRGEAEAGQNKEIDVILPARG